MPFIQMDNANDVKEPETRAEGTYPCVILSAKEKHKEETNSNSIECLIGFDDDPEQVYRAIYHYVALPSPDDDAQKVKNKVLGVRRFCRAFGITFNNGFNLEEFPESRGNIAVTTDEYPEGSGRIKNILGPLPPLPNQ